jgi:N-acetylglutamate synthase/N-acetylornithine aminotransferase
MAMKHASPHLLKSSGLPLNSATGRGEDGVISVSLIIKASPCLIPCGKTSVLKALTGVDSRQLKAEKINKKRENNSELVKNSDFDLPEFVCSPIFS